MASWGNLQPLSRSSTRCSGTACSSLPCSSLPSPVSRVPRRRVDRLPPPELSGKGKTGPVLSALLAGADADRPDQQIGSFHLRPCPSAARLVRLRAGPLRRVPSAVAVLGRDFRGPHPWVRPSVPVPASPGAHARALPDDCRRRRRRPAGGDPRLLPFFRRVRDSVQSRELFLPSRNRSGFSSPGTPW